MRMRTVPVGRRTLFSERRRALLGIAGVAAALLLTLALDAVFAGATRQLSRYIDTAHADVFVAQAGVRTMHMSSSSIPLDRVAEIRRVPGVAWVEPILYQSGALVSPGGRQVAYVVGAVPGAPGGPDTLVAGSAPGPGEVVVDERAAGNVGLRVGGTLTMLGRSWRVSGLTEGYTSISNTVAFVRFDDFAAATGSTGSASYVLVGTRGAPAEVAGAIAARTGLSAQTKAGFSAEERAIVRDMSADLMKIMTTAAFLIGLTVVGLTLYAATLARLRDLGVMKALGSTTPALARMVAVQALWTVGPALVLAVALAFGLSALFGQVTSAVTMVVEPGSILRAAAGAVVLGAVGALSPLSRVARVDPATVFRRPM